MALASSSPFGLVAEEGFVARTLHAPVFIGFAWARIHEHFSIAGVYVVEDMALFVACFDYEQKYSIRACAILGAYM
jgi:hypothetical protein